MPEKPLYRSLRQAGPATASVCSTSRRWAGSHRAGRGSLTIFGIGGRVGLGGRRPDPGLLVPNALGRKPRRIYRLKAWLDLWLAQSMQWSLSAAFCARCLGHTYEHLCSLCPWILQALQALLNRGFFYLGSRLWVTCIGCSRCNAVEAGYSPNPTLPKSLNCKTHPEPQPRAQSFERRCGLPVKSSLKELYEKVHYL